MKVEIEESKLQTAYANACDGVKDFMESLCLRLQSPRWTITRLSARMRMLVWR